MKAFIDRLVARLAAAVDYALDPRARVPNPEGFVLHRTRPVKLLVDHPFLAAVCVAVLVGGSAYYVVAAGPDPRVRTLRMSWQSTAEPVPNTGVDAEGRTLGQWVGGTDASGTTKEAWMAAGKDPRLWVVDAKTKGKPEDWRPVPTRIFQAGGVMYVLRYQEFSNKLAEPVIQRKFMCGQSPNGLTPYVLPSIPAPTRTDGAAVKNHPTWIPANINPAGVTSQVCAYIASAEFQKNPVQKVSVDFAPVEVLIVSPATGTAAPVKAKP